MVLTTILPLSPRGGVRIKVETVRRLDHGEGHDSRTLSVPIRLSRLSLGPDHAAFSYVIYIPISPCGH